ncbi:MAG: cyclic nucleotide-binding domain-containing protein [Chitinivibrionia bacterium]|nr:cyclic nucleotide-binding domain-containing protein [Chitinivibrionia bacterium]
MDIEALFGRIPLFENLSPSGRKALAEISLAREIPKKELLFLEGDQGASICVLARGNVQLYRSTPEGKEIVIKVVKPGELFGEVVLFEQRAYPVNAVALQDSTVLMISRHQFARLLENEPFRHDFQFYLNALLHLSRLILDGEGPKSRLLSMLNLRLMTVFAGNGRVPGSKK